MTSSAIYTAFATVEHPIGFDTKLKSSVCRIPREILCGYRSAQKWTRPQFYFPQLRDIMLRAGISWIQFPVKSLDFLSFQPHYEPGVK